MSFAFDSRIPFTPIAVYGTAIQLMYELANRGWTSMIHAMTAGEIPGVDLVILFINPAAVTAPQQLQVMHCVVALYRAVVAMTDGVSFCHLKSHLSVWGEEVGLMSVAPVVGPARGEVEERGGNSSSLSAAAAAAAAGRGEGEGVLENDTLTTRDGLRADSGQVKDPDYPDFVLKYYFFGKPIPSKEVSMAILVAMATAAPFGPGLECKELLAISPYGGCSIVIESVRGGDMLFTHAWATRALKVLYQGIVVPQKRWGDLVLVLIWKGERFGELRMLRGVRGRNSIGAVASER
ncbi:MAG: hypothetical protein Q9208_008091 [Pyrenodesmia sp. 3 TL-2023]